MEKRRAVLITNPNAGRGGGRRAAAVENFRARLARRGVGVEVWPTTGAGDAARLAARAAREGFRELIVSGGDGTINEALQGLVGAGEVRLAVWPAGTANVLARELRLPFDADGAAEVCARGRTLRVAVGCATEERSGARRYFILMAGIGLDASVVERVRPRLKRRIGKAAFWYSGLGHLLSWTPEEFQIEVGGESYPATFAAIGNAPRYGGGLSVTPRARLDRPEFEVCIINSHSRLHYLYFLSHAMRGGMSEHATAARFIRTTRLRAAGHAPVQVDGELIGHLPMTFEIIPEHINIVVP
ncbi:MAG TPA: YegS/Rv2252/BmrU family lipid kinase [Pyrinomonadaceae bacterium]|jgi:YegS/Rv2252/BmrU family lipid kinase|nr:YegS/Rv2252/BmrU family lipid kinase [Pyrinomonadaceae bacterium]